MKPHLFAAFLCLAALHPVAAQTSEAPSMNPEAGKSSGDKKNDPLGMGDLTKGRPKDAKTEITAKKEATFDNASSIAEFEGSVVVKDPQFTLFCDRLKVTLNKDRKGLELVEAFANQANGVVIIQDNVDDSGKKVRSVGRATYATFTPANGDVVLKGSPSVQNGPNLQIGEKDTIMILNRNGKMKTIGPSRTTLTDTGEAKQMP